MRKCGCNEFNRAQLLRAATDAGAAEAGHGLPSIEAGMPKPAGTGLSRRKFVMRSSGLLLSVYGASKLGLKDLQAGIAHAAGNDPVIVTVFMEGGIDGLSVLAPVNDAYYVSHRPQLKLDPLTTSAFTEDTNLHWHPSANGLRDLHQAGKVSVMPAVSYHDPNQSHFTSRHYWEVGQLDPNGVTGWMGRMLDEMGTINNPLQGLSLDGSLSPALATAVNPVAAIDGPRYNLDSPVWSGEIEELMFSTIDQIGHAHLGGDRETKAAANAAVQGMDVRNKLQPYSGGVTDPPYYPANNGFADNLAALAAMLGGGLDIRCVSVRAPGSYDTHENEAQNLPGDLKDTVDGLVAFQRDIEDRGLADRVITLVWSEFGRRPEENGYGDTAGTDHGAAGVGFVIGTKVEGKLLGEFPGLSQLDDDDNEKYTTDFRKVYRSIIADWFNQDAEKIIPVISSDAPDLINPVIAP